MNINDYRKGQKVKTLPTARVRRRAEDFPGWGDPDYAKHLLAPVPGMTGVCTDVESHGSRPWTRYGVRYEDGSRSNGLIEGTDIEFI